MELITLYNGRRGLHRGRTSQGCLLILLPVQCIWMWVPEAMVASRRRLKTSGIDEVLSLTLAN